MGITPPDPPIVEVRLCTPAGRFREYRNFIDRRGGALVPLGYSRLAYLPEQAPHSRPKGRSQETCPRTYPSGRVGSFPGDYRSGHFFGSQCGAVARISVRMARHCRTSIRHNLSVSRPPVLATTLCDAVYTDIRYSINGGSPWVMQIAKSWWSEAESAG